MNRPEKKAKLNNSLKIDSAEKILVVNIGYNAACDDWEKFLPSEEELCNLMAYSSLSNKEIDVLAKSISKRIRG